MKRDPALVPFTHDHHHGLAQARRLRLAASRPGPDLAGAAEGMLDFYEAELLTHFRDEEELLFPLLVEATGAAPEELVGVLFEHVEIHSRMLRLRRDLGEGTPSAADLMELARRLEAHIHSEERSLFPLIERAVPKAKSQAELQTHSGS